MRAWKQVRKFEINKKEFVIQSREMGSVGRRFRVRVRLEKGVYETVGVTYSSFDTACRVALQEATGSPWKAGVGTSLA